MTKTFVEQSNSDVKARWVKQYEIHHLTFITKNVIAFGRGSTITFINLDNGREHVYRCLKTDSSNKTDPKTGNIKGVACIAGHKSYAIFAFAELTISPRIMLLSYPDFRHITTLGSFQIDEYLSLDFSESDHLVAITSLPHYLIEVWNWRTDRLLAVQPTDLFVDDKFIRCSFSLPLTIFQMTYSKTRIDFWEAHISLDTVNLIKRSITLPAEDNPRQTFDAAFYIDGSLCVVNQCGCVWNIAPATNKDLKIISLHSEDISNSTSLIGYYNGGLIVATDATVKLYNKKSSGKWTESWSLTQPVDIKSIACFDDQLVLLTVNGDIIKVNENAQGNPVSQKIASFRRCFKLIGLLNPIGEYFVAITAADEIIVYEILSGQEKSVLVINHIHCMASHESLPVITVGTRNGTVHILSILDPKIPTIIHRFYLCVMAIETIQYMPGRNDIIAHSNDGLFIITGEFGNEMQVQKVIKIDDHLLDFVVSTTKQYSHKLNILTVPKDKPNKHYGNQITEVFILDDGNESITGETEYSYTSIRSNLEIGRSIFIAARYNSKFIDFVEVLQNSTELNFSILKSIETQHQLNYCNISIDLYFLLSWSLDGMMFVWDLSNTQLIQKYQAHSGHTYGIKSAICTPSGEFIISLGHSGNMVCYQMGSTIHLSRKLTTLQSALENTSFARNIINEDNITAINKEGTDKPWIEIQAKLKLEEQQKQYADERNAIIEEFNSIKEKLKICIDANEADPIEEQLPIQSFNLDVDGKQSLIEKARNNREMEMENLKKVCEEQNALIDWIKRNTWDLMEVKSTKLRGIFSKLCVENYALRCPDKKRELQLKRIHFWRTREQMSSAGDIFFPWIPRNVQQLEEQFAIEPSVVQTAEAGLSSFTSFANLVRSHFSFLKQDNGMNVTESEANYALSGTSTHLYVKPLPIRYGQMEVVTYNQMFLENQMGFYDMLQLRKFFNKKFDVLMEEKKTEIGLVKERNKRLLEIYSELNILEELDGLPKSHNEIINDPELLPDEMPESIIRIDDSEVGVKPYITSSQQDDLVRQAEEVERRRKEMLEDDFRERALVAMMDGVLEIRWEDEIKKDPPKPNCLETAMDPIEYTNDDIKELDAYEEKLKQVKSERKKYFDMLVDEKINIHQLLDDQVLNFNKKVGETLLTKIRVEFAICSEEMKLLLYSKFNFERNEFREREEKLLKEKREIKNDIDELMKTLAMLDSNFYTIKTKYDDLVLKDRTLDKQFKSSFSEYAAQAVVDQAYRMFRRRPKLHPKASQTAAILADMARRVNAADTSLTGPPLPSECYQYLNLLDSIEKFSNGPNLLDQNLWQILCRMRRAKIEVELKLRSYGEQVAEAEAAINAYSREISFRKSKLVQCDKKIDDLKEQQVKHLINREVLIYTKRGNVEIPLTGRISDFENTILLHKSKLDETNAIIQEAGKRKLKVMQKAATFRRHVQCQEWKHKVLKLKIEDMKNTIKVIDKCKVTKEVQVWLKRKQMGRPEDLSESAMERELSGRIKAYERAHNDLLKKSKHLDALIDNEIRQNDILDQKIQNLNFDLQEQNLLKDVMFNEKEVARRNARMATIIERARLVRKVQQQHSHILEHSTMLELQRLRTYPTLNLNKPTKKP